MTAPAWYGSDPRWVGAFDARAYRDFGSRLRVSVAEIPGVVGDPAAVRMGCGRVVPLGSLPSTIVGEPYRLYRISDVDVQARTKPIEVTVVFERYRNFGGRQFADGRNFPAVYADRYDESPHRYADGSLCLYYPLDLEQRRWTPDKGLRSLVSLAADHVFFEDWHRQTGAWIAPEAPHGFPDDKRKAA